MRPTGLLFLVLIASPLLAQYDDSPSVQLIQQHGIEPTRDSIKTYFESQPEDPQNRRKFADLVEDLGNASYVVREAATKSLLSVQVAHFDLLEQAVKSKNLEKQYRAQRVLAALQNRSPQERHEDVLHAVLRVVANKKIKGLADPILNIALRSDETLQIRKIVRALCATVDATDRDLLVGALKHDSASIRVVAIAGVEKILGEQSVASIVPLLADSDEWVRLAASRVLANIGDRRSLPELAEMLKSNTPGIRSQSVYMLRQLTGKRFGFRAFENPENQTDAVTQWNQWIGGDGATAKLDFPFQNFGVDPSGLVLDFSFGGQGEQVHDNSEYANHGSIVNALQTVNGRHGAGCKMDGSGDYIRVANSESLEITDRVSLVAWIKLDSFGPGGYGNEDGHIIKKGDPLWWNPAFSLGFSKRNNRAKFVIGDPHTAKNGGGKSLYSEDELEVGRWYFLVGTFDGKTVKLFIDGRLDQEVEYTGRIRTDQAPVLLGGGKLSSKTEFANHFAISGTIDEVKIYNRALSASEVDSLFNQ